MSMQISVSGNYDAIDFESITVSSSAIGPTAAMIADDKGQAPYYALFTVETNSVRFRMDGTDPTASVGHKVDAGQNVEIHGKGNVARIKFIAVTADATVMASYGR